MKILLTILLCTSVHAQALRVRAERIEPIGIITSCGTAHVTEQGIVTAAHVVEQGVVTIETAEGWVKCEVLRRDDDLDIAILRPARKIKAEKAKDGCHASVRGTPIECLKVTLRGTLTAEIEGFDHGGSGSPIYHKGKFVGICVAMCGPIVRFVPALLVQAFLEGQ
jgi:hypothetical protein